MWEPADVGNPEDAQAAAKRLTDLAKERADLIAARDDAIRRCRTEDGMTYRAIADLLDMTERNVHFIVAGKPRDTRP